MYANFASIIARLYFPANYPLTALLLTFAIFASGFLVRPFGALLFGYIGDHLGRRSALITSISLMSLPSLIIGFVPTYASIGVMAPCLLLLLRLCQGLAVSGELSAATTFLVEHAPSHQRGLAGSMVMSSVFLGILSGAVLSTCMTEWLTPKALIDWGWRVLFIFGGLMGVIGLVLRLKLPKHQMTAKRMPLLYVFKQYPKQLVLVIALTSIMAVANYILIAYILTFLVKFSGFSLRQANVINLLSFILIVLLFPLMGWLSDKKGRKTIFKLGLYGFIIGSLPIFWLLSQRQFYYALAGDLLLCLVLAPIAALVPTMLAELFPTYIRSTGSTIGYNICLAVFGGTAPLVAFYLVAISGSTLAPAWYLIACALLAWLALHYWKENYQQSLH